MKIAVITLHAIKNYGSVLQAIATQHMLEKHGCEVEFINFLMENEITDNSVRIWAKGNMLKAIAMIPTVNRWRKVFDDFIKRNLNVSKNTYISSEDFVNNPVVADAYCTGSDQVWNSIWNNGIITPFYLDFIPRSAYKFSFSSSFGQNRLDEDEITKTSELINQYKYISVRENSAKLILEEQYDYHNVFQLADPTICVEPEFWRKYEGKRRIKDAYLLVYNLNRSKAFDDYAVKLSKVTGLKLVRLCTRYDQFYRPGKSVLIPTISEFIELIDHAQYVLTDSFHATAFSMNMETQPICIYPPCFETRIDSFLTLVNSQQRHVKNYEDLDVLNRPVDFDVVRNILQNERKKANEFIDMVISEIKDRKDISENSL